MNLAWNCNARSWERIVGSHDLIVSTSVIAINLKSREHTSSSISDFHVTYIDISIGDYLVLVEIWIIISLGRRLRQNCGILSRAHILSSIFCKFYFLKVLYLTLLLSTTTKTTKNAHAKTTQKCSSPSYNVNQIGDYELLKVK